MKQPKPKCQMTMGQYGNYFECGKPAKFTIHDNLRGKMNLCGTHARNREKVAKRLGFELPKPIETK